MVLCFIVMSSFLLRQLKCVVDLFCSYCADLVQKRLHNDVMPLIEAMQSGFNLVCPLDLHRLETNYGFYVIF